MTKTELTPYNWPKNQKINELLEKQLRQTKKGDKGCDFEKLFSLINHTYNNYEKKIHQSNQDRDYISQKLIQANEIIQKQCSQYELALTGSNEGLWDWDYLTQTVFYSDRWKEMLGYPRVTPFDTINEWINRIHPDYKDQVQMELNMHLLKLTERFECEYKIKRQDGHYQWMLAQGRASWDKDGNIIRVVGCQSDISQQKEYQSQLSHAILHDPLTGLPNRTLLTTRLDHFVNKISRYKKTYIQGAILYINLDRFKIINENMGHSIGDKILKEFTHRLEKLLRPEDTLARFGGDEFIILLENINHIDIAEDIAHRVSQKLNIPFFIDEEQIFLSASIGICGIFNNKSSGEVILRNANIAMSQAKSLGRRRYFLFNEAIHINSIRQLRMEKDLHLALEKNELFLLYQPIVNLGNDSISGFEALVRWKHPVLGIVSPNQFIPIAEESGLIRPIGEYVLRSACEQLKKWKSLIFHRYSSNENPEFQKEMSSLSMSVNLSINQLSDPATVQRLLDVIDEFSFEDFSIKLEITESTLAQNIDLCKSHLEVFKSKHIKLCIDDFGTGFSSLSQLDSFPFDILKIDRNFVSRMESDDKAESMVEGIINLSHNLHYTIIAEGVETLEQLNSLKKMKCEFGQGYFFSPPVTAEEAESLVFKGPSNISQFINPHDNSTNALN